ncbi:lipopolysaccharide biosynthesis protein [Sphingomonas sp. S2-65]|uniref:lipopolysaccharide biosynthesis protein n=1 Tax=Sphingomonas sp. S2-65 TaxID=2903960 RepID=UPI001F268114|nr:lipopolysaccharide biosynthesis protein [Sphingomonas sp. S2-65]UYY57068.1 lipopolysaccharide biosynthesis protein [Sphingomonas sp. S2-65]
MTITAFDSPSGGFREHATNGAVITGVAQAIKFVVQTSSVIVLARLLTPVDYGLIAMVTPILGFVMMFQDFGLTQATVQKKDINHAQVSSLFWMNLGFSLILSVLLIAASPLIALFYGDPRIAPLTVAFGCLVFVNGLGSQHMALLNRQMRFGALALIDTAAAILSFAGALLFAILWDNYWALFVGSLILSATPVIGSWSLVRWIPGRPARAEGLGEILGFGGGITGFGFANFFARNLDNVLIGWRWGDQAVGTYDRAYKLLLMPLQQVTGPLARVLQPVLARLVDEPERYRNAYLNSVRQMLLLVLPGVIFMIGTSDVLIVTLLGPEWVAAGKIFSALGYAALVQALNNPTGWLFVSQGRTREYMLWGFFSSTTSILAFVCGLWAGPFGVAAAYAISEYLRTPLLWAVVTRSGPVRPSDIIRTTTPHIAACVTTLILVHLLRRVPSLPSIELLGLALASSYAAYLAVMFLFSEGRSTMTDSLNILRGLIDRVMRVAR